MISIKNIIYIVIGALVAVGLAFILLKILKRMSALEKRMIFMEKKNEFVDIIEQQTRPVASHVSVPREEPILFEEFFKIADDGPTLEESNAPEESSAPLFYEPFEEAEDAVEPPSLPNEVECEAPNSESAREEDSIEPSDAEELSTLPSPE